MAWKKYTIDRNGVKWLIATETLTWSSSAAGGQDLTGSAIDFLVPGKDFILMSNTGATSLSSDADIDIKCTYTSSGTYSVLVSDAEATATNAVHTYFYDVSAVGEAPYLRVFVDSAGVQKKKDTIAFAIMQKV